ncbi:hypothetical protein HWV62_36242 [Athelia sp. TMB]|nr:hypothetical protein HWV62_36242 [Athelia sp. TMB]
MDGPGKPYLSQPALALTGDDEGGGSSRSASTSGSQRLSGTSTWSALGRDHGRMAKSESMPGQRRLSMPAVATATVHGAMAPRGVPEIVVSQPRSPAHPTTNVLAPTHAEAPAISNSPPKQHPNPAVSTTTTSPAAPKAPISPPVPIVLPPTPPAATTTTPPTAPRPRTAPPKRAPPKAPSGRPTTATATPMRIADMPPPVFRMNENGTAQLSPALTTRRSAKPLLNLPLPPLPPPAAPANKRASSLRSMPALSLAGRSDLHMEGDHVNSVLDEDEEGEDEEEEVHTPPTGEGGSDEEGEDLTHPVEPVVPVRTLRRMKLPSIDTARAFGKGKTPAGARREGDATPTAAAATFDYFSVVPQPGPSETPGVRQAQTPRPVMYHQVSRSMVNILSPKVEPVPEPASAVEPSAKGKGKAPETLGMTSPAPEYAPPEPASPTSPLRRQRSMPVFTAAAAPPPYPSFAPFPAPPHPHPARSVFAIQPREDEGRERLPPYSNAIHLRAVLPRKMEFAAPGVQARDRKWRRALCELEGTAFRVYRVPAGGWWEKAVGAGDAAVVGRMERVEKGAEVRPAKLTEDARPLGGGEAEAGPDTTTIVLPKPKRLSANLLHPHSHPRSRSHSRSRSDPQEAAPRGPLSTPRSSSSQLSSPSSSASSSNLTASTSSHTAHSPRGKRGKHTDAWADPDPADLIRAYTVQHAESGLGNDYVKRKNVIRVRMEGEQFLLQAQDVADVVEWIEGFHAATNIALDLDERTMPKGPMFPRFVSIVFVWCAC